MNFPVEQDKLQKFKRAVFFDVDQKVAEITKQMEELRKTTLEQTEDQQLNTAYNTLQENVQKIRNDFKRYVSKASLNARHDVLRQRESYKQQIFSAVASRLAEYRKTDDYQRFLLERLKKLEKEYCLDGCTIITGKGDQWLEERLSKEKKEGFRFETDPKIKLGGFLIRNDSEGYLLDETFDSGLKDQNDYFNQYCKLTEE